MRPSVRAVPFFAFLALVVFIPGVQAAGILAPTESGVPPLEVRVHKVTATIADQVARTRVEQTFYNPSPRQLEAHYLFPVPKGAQVTDFVLYMNGEAVKAEVVEKEKAAQIYQDIVRRMRDPGLLEFIDRELYRIRVFPVPAQGEVKIEIEFSQVLSLDGGAVTYTYPGTIPGYARGPSSDLDFRFIIKSNAPIRSIYSPTHAVRFDKKRDNEATGRLAARGGADQDATLIYTLSKDDVGINALAYRPDFGEDGFFLILVSPKLDFREEEIQPKAVTFVLDTSGSMAKDGKIHQAKAALKYCLDSLKPKDSFNVIAFQTTVESFAENLVSAERKNVEDAEKWVEKIDARGGTNIDEALRRALRDAPPEGAVHTIAFMTDGQPTVGVTDPNAILDNLRQANEAGLRIFSFGVGFDVNAALLDRVAEDTRALSQYIKPQEDIEVVVSAFFDKVSNPVLTNCELSIKGVKTADVFPVKMPDLFLGSQLTVLGRYKDAGEADIELRGRLGEKKETFAFKTAFPEEDDERDYIEPLWGQRKVGYLLDEIRRHGENPELRDEVIELSKRYGIATPYTSLLATEDTAIAQQERARQMPLGAMAARPAATGTPPRGGAYGMYGGRVSSGGGSYSPNQGTVSLGQITRSDKAAAASPAAAAGEPERASGGDAFSGSAEKMAGRAKADQRSLSMPLESGSAAKSSNGYPDHARDALRGGVVSQGAVAGSSVVAKPSLGPSAEAASASPSAPPVLMPLSRDVVSLPSAGQAGVETSKIIAEKKQAETVKKEGAVQEKRASGRRFILKDGVWIDQTIAKREKALEVKCLSEAYFALLKRRPDLKQALKLGEKVEIRLDDTTILRIGEKGKEKLEAADETLLDKTKPAKR